MADFAKGTARVRLQADGDETILHYEVEAQVGGKLNPTRADTDLRA